MFFLNFDDIEYLSHDFQNDIFPFLRSERDVFEKCWLIKFGPSNFFFFFGRAENFTLKFDYFHFLNISFVELSDACKSGNSFQFYTLAYYNTNCIEQRKAIIEGVQCKYQQFH